MNKVYMLQLLHICEIDESKDYLLKIHIVELKSNFWSGGSMDSNDSYSSQEMRDQMNNDPLGLIVRRFWKQRII